MVVSGRGLKAVILGAGPCGLTAAWDLAEAGADVTVIEKESAPGGLCVTNRRDGYQFDLGGHRFISPDRELVDDVKRLLGDRLIPRKRKSVIRFRDRVFDYPVNPANVLANATAGMSLRFAAGYAASALGLYRSAAPAGSFEAWVDGRFGRPLNEYFFKPYTEKLWGVPASALSDVWAGQRISVINAGAAALAAFLPRARRPRTYAVDYLYPLGGIGEIFETMAARIESLGGRIFYGARPAGIRTAGGRVEAVEAALPGGERGVFDADEFLSTIPLDQTARLLGAGNGERLPFRSLRFLNIMLDGVEDVSDNTWMYTPDRDVVMTRIQEPKRRSPRSAPQGRTSVMLEIPCQYGDGVWTASDEAMAGRATLDLAALGIDLRRNVRGVFSTFARRAYPVQELGGEAKIEKLTRAVNACGNLRMAGRQGLFRYIFMDAAMLMGRRWARNLLNGGEGPIDEHGTGVGTVIETGSVAV